MNIPKNYLFYFLITLASIGHIIFHDFSIGRGILSNISGLIGSFIPAILIAYLLCKTDKDKEGRLMIFTFVYIGVLAVSILGQFL